MKKLKTVAASHFVFLILIVGFAAFAARMHALPAPPEITAQKALQDALVDERQATRTPGASAAIFRDGELLWQGFDGKAEANAIPVNANTLYSLASVTKMFVATMVLRLSEDGKLRLDDPIAGYVPDYMPSTSVVRHN